MTTGDKSPASPKYEFQNNALSQPLLISGWGQIGARKRLSLRARGGRQGSPLPAWAFKRSVLFFLTFPSWPESVSPEGSRKHTQPIVTQAPGRCLPWAFCVNRKGLEWGPWGSGGHLGELWLGQPLPGDSWFTSLGQSLYT